MPALAANRPWAFRELVTLWAEHDYPEYSTSILPSERIVRLAQLDGLAQANADELDRLSTHPENIRQWLALIQLDVEKPDADDRPVSYLSYCLLEAAATSQSIGPLEVSSVDGHFKVGLFPGIDDPQGLVTVEACTPEAQAWEGHTVRVRDGSGRILLQGRLFQGRVAQFYSPWPAIDLSRGAFSVSVGDHTSDTAEAEDAE